jgi:1-deoxy-D-xylulose-5-phosphate reductoisomerase
VPTSVSVVGSTGSIGTQALDVLRASSGAFTVSALGASRSISLLAAQAREFRPPVVALADESLAPALKDLLPAGIELRAGDAALASLGGIGDVVLNGVVGFAGLAVTLTALAAGKRLALANKQSLIAGAPAVAAVRDTPGAEIIPVDSEHCAIHQCLRSGSSSEVGRLVLTASGGPFRGRSASSLAGVTVADALAHPTWAMGPQNTIDSSTLMNKGLEVLEAHELFGVDFDRIEVVVHPQSVVHSMVEWCDGSTIAQLSMPDMRLPIGYALGWPSRLDVAYGPVDWSAVGSLTFEAPDRSVFACLDLAYAAGRAGGLAPAWLVGANEVAVAAFLEGRIGWASIAEVVAGTMDRCSPGLRSGQVAVDDIYDADRRARERAGKLVEAMTE